MSQSTNQAGCSNKIISRIHQQCGAWIFLFTDTVPWCSKYLNTILLLYHWARWVMHEPPIQTQTWSYYGGWLKYTQIQAIILQYTDNHWVWAKISEHLHVLPMELCWGNDVNAIDGGENDINFDSYWCFWWVQVKKHAPSTIFDREYEVWYGGMRKRILFSVHFTCIAWINLPFATFQRNIFRWIQFRHFSEYSIFNILDQRFFRMKFSGFFFNAF